MLLSTETVFVVIQHAAMPEIALPAFRWRALRFAIACANWT
jgi:hypothetical protein